MILQRFLVLFLYIGILLLISPYALAGWIGFYTSKEQEPSQSQTAQWPVQNICVREILLAQERYDIPENILLGIGLQEAGTWINKQLVVWPWAINAEGRGSFFDTKARAINWVQEHLNQGMQSIDVGCMQVNLRWHPDAFDSLGDAFTPKINVDYAARLLLSHYKITGTWRSAAGRYHSKTPEKQKIYLTSLERNIRVANTQIAKFRMIAGFAPSGIITVNQRITNATPQLQGRRFWTSALSSQGMEKVRSRSLYSHTALQPILPSFTQNKLRGTK